MIALKFRMTLMLAGAAALLAAPVYADTDKNLDKPATDAADLRGTQWSTVITRAGGGHVLGNPDAAVKIKEYVSYTCPHCATFARQGEPAIKLYYVPTGRVSLEVRHVIRDPIDWTAAVLTNCGEPSKFAQNHALFMGEQPKWLEEARKATPGQKQRWSNPNRTLARKAIASDLGFEELMERRGYSRTEIDRCLSDNDAATTLVIQSMEEAKAMNVSGTPSFAIDGTLLEGTHSWQPLQMQIDTAIKAKRAQ